MARRRRRRAGALALLGAVATLSGCATTSTGTASSPSSIGLGTAGAPATSASTTVAGARSPVLQPAHGYGTYGLCQGICTGAVPMAVRRPLHLPTPDGGPCPVTVHVDGPVSPSTSTQVGFAAVTASDWRAAEVTWSATAGYSGPVLIRGGSIGGSIGGSLGFGDGRTPYRELQLLDAGRFAPRVTGGGRAWMTYTRIRASGCYSYQVDGTSFSAVIVFRAVG